MNAENSLNVISKEQDLKKCSKKVMQRYECKQNKDISIISGFKESYLIVCGIDQTNDNSEGKIIISCPRNENGTFDPIDVYCIYETGLYVWYLRVCLLDFKKVYIYKLDYNIEKLNDPDTVEYKILFDLNTAMNKLDPFKAYEKVDVCVYTCYCFETNCIIYLDKNDNLEPEQIIPITDNWELEQMITIRPYDEKE